MNLSHEACYTALIARAACAASRIENGFGNLSELAALRTSSRHLHRVMEKAFSVSPVERIQTGRLLLAKRLLTDTDLPVTEIAFASGQRNRLRRFS